MFSGLYGVVKFLTMKHPQDIHSQCVDDKSTPLHLASREGHVKVICILVEHGIDMIAQDKHELIPLHHASLNGHLNLACLPVEHSTNVMAQNKVGWTLLHEASFNGHIDLACLLVKHSADVTALGMDGWTPLHQACHRRARGCLGGGFGPTSCKRRCTEKGGIVGSHLGRWINCLHLGPLH